MTEIKSEYQESESMPDRCPYKSDENGNVLFQKLLKTSKNET